MLEDLLTALIGTVVSLAVVVLIVGIFAANIYAILHAWRSDRVLWAVVLLVLFLGGGGIATAVYLFLHWGEPMPPASPRRRATA
jgi:hypothetical protein